MNKREQLLETELYIRREFEKEGSGHDWWHIERVRKLSLKIATAEDADLFIVELAALLHDLDDWKLNGNDPELYTKTNLWLDKIKLDKVTRNQIIKIVKQVSFKGAGIKTKPDIIEAQIVQDADRLDAIGAIGIARAFSYGGNRNRLLYDPNSEPEYHETFEAYKANSGSTINHFYEKLILLKDLMNTETAKKYALARHVFMEKFLHQFFDEWEANN